MKHLVPTAASAFRALAVLAVIHSVAVASVWLSFSLTDFSPLSSGAWVVLAWLWLLWLPVLAMHPGRTFLRVALPALLGLAVLAPCAPALVTFTAWSLGGFAP